MPEESERLVIFLEEGVVVGKAFELFVGFAVGERASVGEVYRL
jgi:hypothetical protein